MTVAGNETQIGLVVSGGTGRMGQTVAQLASADPRIRLLGALDREDAAEPEGQPLTKIAEAGSILSEADVVVDFSAPEFVRALLEMRADALAGTALVIGTTGLDPTTLELIDAAAEHSPVLMAANFSVGVNLLLALTERAAAALGDEFDVEIVETHHRRKEDAPSGTALALGEAVAEGRKVDLAALRRDGRSGRPGPRPDGEIGFHALRGGDVIGDHQVHFIGALERIELGHRAADRRLFAAGALHAARWIAGRSPGRYTMRQVLGL